MAKIIIEIEDTFTSRCEGIFEQVTELVKSYKKDNPEESVPDLGTLDYSGDIHEIVDSSVPVYTKEILDIWYLYRQELLSAYEDAGVGTNPNENDGMVAIYFLMQEKLAEWYAEKAEDIWNQPL